MRTPIDTLKDRIRGFLLRAVRDGVSISNDSAYGKESLADIKQSLDSLRSTVMMAAQDFALYRHFVEDVRNSNEYDFAYTVSDPKVSIIVPTHRAPEVMWNRTLPSLIKQTHSNLEIIISIDGNYSAIFPSVLERVAHIKDERIRVICAPPQPLHFPETQNFSVDNKTQFQWFSSGNGPYNFASDLAAGHWIAPFSHDDELDETAIEAVLAHVKKTELEYCYAPMRRLDPAGVTTLNFSFPPEMYHFGVQGSLLHSALRFFKYEYRDAAFGIPNDWGFVRTMMLSGVKVGAYDHPVSNYYPNQLFKND